MLLTPGWAILLGAASLWTVQIVYKDLVKSDKRLKVGK